MNKNKKLYPSTSFVLFAFFFAVFMLIIYVISFIDVEPVGPQGSLIGLSGLNMRVFKFFGYNSGFYTVTEILGYVAIAVAGGFALLGGYQLITRKSLKKIDPDLYLLAGFYVLVVAAYVVFELIVINYRPVLMENELEASFPSSHTMLIICIMGTAIHQFYHRIENNLINTLATIGCIIITVVVVMGRLISGVHWFTDILGAVVLSLALLNVYFGGYKLIQNKLIKE